MGVENADLAMSSQRNHMGIVRFDLALKLVYSGGNFGIGNLVRATPSNILFKSSFCLAANLRGELAPRGIDDLATIPQPVMYW